MREEYDIEKLNPRKNPYANRLKKQIPISIAKSQAMIVKRNLKKKGFPTKHS